MQSDNDLVREFRQFLREDQHLKRLLKQPFRPKHWEQRLMEQPFKPSWQRKQERPHFPQIPVKPGPSFGGGRGMLFKLARLRRLNIPLELFLSWQEEKFKKQIEELENPEPGYQPGRVEIGPHWNMTSSCGPWREDNVVVGGNFCFVHLGVPEAALLKAVPPGFLSFYTVQNDGLDVPGGIDCTKAKQYEAPDLNPEPRPTFHPPMPMLPLFPETPAPENPALPWTRKYGPLRGFPPPAPWRHAPYLPGRQSGGNHRRKVWSKTRQPVLKPGNPGNPPPHIVQPPGPRTKEIKGRIKLGKWFRAAKRLAEQTLETIDVLKAAYNALPWDVRRKYLEFGKQPTPQQMAAILYLEVTKVDPSQFIKQLAINLIEMEYQDRVIGDFSQRGTKAIKGNPYWNSPVGLEAGASYRGAPVYW